MHIAVLGAGIVGATTAYYLAEQGHRVSLIDRSDSVASATSFANGAQLSYSYTDSLARPEFLPRIPSLVLGLDPAIRVRLLSGFGLYPWGLRFLAQCTHAKARANTLTVLELALRSAELLDALQSAVELQFSYRRAGKLVVLAHESELAGARERAAWKRSNGCETTVISSREALELEPALDAMRQSFAGAIYSPNDEVGDAQAFAAGLVDWLVRERGVSLRLCETVTGVVADRGILKAIRTEHDELSVDAAVVCLGPWSSRLLRSAGVNVAIYPVRGYSVTLPHGAQAPRISITNLEHRIVFSNLANGVRIAGFADFVGEDHRRDDTRLEKLLDTARQIAPQAADYSAERQHRWGGSRPVTPDSRPIVGPTKVRGLYLNVGHGVLGWTLACATANNVAHMLAETA